VILLDTDICVALLRGHRTVLERRKATADDVAIAAITAAELFYGAEKSLRPIENRSLVEQFLITVPVLHTDLPIIRLFAQLKVEIESAGRPLPDADILIAATCLAHCDRVVTGNSAHFSRFPGLVIENWLR
jgi:tRNA(fMet)-specific endonuclease VapC